MSLRPDGPRVPHSADWHNSSGSLKGSVMTTRHLGIGELTLGKQKWQQRQMLVWMKEAASTY